MTALMLFIYSLVNVIFYLIIFHFHIQDVYVYIVLKFRNIFPYLFKIVICFIY